MKHIIIGDLHGKDCWRTINIKKYDKVVFIGDYTDAWTLSDLAIYQNLQNIIKLRSKTGIRWYCCLVIRICNTCISPVPMQWFPAHHANAVNGLIQQ